MIVEKSSKYISSSSERQFSESGRRMSPLLRLLANSIQLGQLLLSVIWNIGGTWEAVDVLLTMEITTRLQIFVIIGQL